MKEKLNPMKNLPNLSDLNNLKVQRKHLEEAEATFREAIEDQFDVLEEVARKWGRTILIIGGTALVGFGIAQAIIQARREKNEESTTPDTEESPQQVTVTKKEESAIVRAIKNQIAMFLAGLVKQKLMEFLENIDRLEDDDVDQPQTEGPVKEV